MAHLTCTNCGRKGNVFSWMVWKVLVRTIPWCPGAVCKTSRMPVVTQTCGMPFPWADEDCQWPAHSCHTVVCLFLLTHFFFVGNNSLFKRPLSQKLLHRYVFMREYHCVFALFLCSSMLIFCHLCCWAGETLVCLCLLLWCSYCWVPHTAADTFSSPLPPPCFLN